MNKGFTLVESLVAIAILTLVISSVGSAVSRTMSLHSASKEQVIAYYLAQEAIETIRSRRDENGLVPRNWLNGIAENSSDACYFGNRCTVDATTGVLERCPGGAGSCPVVRQNSTTGLYGQNSAWAATDYRREVTITSVNSSEISILAEISWQQGGETKQFRARENILNWQQ